MHTQITRLCRQKPFEQDTNKMLEWVMNQLEGREIEFKNILRWEDDGGKITDTAQAVDWLASELISRERKKYSKGTT
jgi:predicted RNA-binding protein with EMAP domain